ncbi:MAG: DUF309 domain-containing protein [Phycisphaerales bacterium]
MPRRHTDDPFPPYAHRPGRTPHPLTDPRGHSHALVAAGPTWPKPIRASEWHQSHAYLLGIDLHNHGYWWEAHEEWEGLWRQAPAESAHARLLQAMIQSCALWLKLDIGENAGAQRLLARARPHVQALAGTGTVLGVRVPTWWQAVEDHAALRLAGHATADPPCITLATVPKPCA